MKNSRLFFNRCFDKTRLKNFILWFFNKYGTKETIQLLENLKKIGFKYATKAGISIGIDDLKIPFIKSKNIEIAEKKIQVIEINYERGNITEIENQQQSIREWNLASEKLKFNVIQFFKATDIFNPIYMISFSGARGNISQVRQLIGMRGLMVDPQGQVLEFPIRSNFREGLNLTEYIISCYGARKGVVDTALRTATSGYLTRRLVDVAQQVVISKQNCQTNRGIPFNDLVEDNKVILFLRDRLVGRILLKDIFELDLRTKTKYKIGLKNQEISSRLSVKISQLKKPVLLRSPLTCNSRNSICQLCYGWSLAHSKIVSIGEAVGVLAAQSIGEPGTQLTMRTFHTGGVFTGSLINQIYAPFEGVVDYLNPFRGLLIRTSTGQIGFLTKTKGHLQVKRRNLIKKSLKKEEFHRLSLSTQYKVNLSEQEETDFFLLKIQQIESKFEKEENISNSSFIFNIPIYTTLFIRHKEKIFEKGLMAELLSSSFLQARGEETEEDIFSPVSGQIFFENLVLIEKTTKEGIVHRTTYGVGAIWVIAGVFWSTFFSKNAFPSHGDFITFSSTSREVHFLIKKPDYLNLQLSESTQKFYHFRMNLFSMKDKNLISKFKLLNNLFLNRSLLYLDFKNLYYQDFRYFALIHLKKSILNITFFKLTNFLSPYRQFVKKNHAFFDLNEQILGLNFYFSQNFSFKSDFLFGYIPFLPKKMTRKFFFTYQFLERVQSKCKQPVFSRKLFDFEKKNLNTSNEPFWINFIEDIRFNDKKIDFLKLCCWSFYLKDKKGLQKIEENLELPLQRKNLFNLITSSLETYKTEKLNQNKLLRQFSSTKVLKNFLNWFNLRDFSLYLETRRFTQVSKKFNWVSNFQLFSILLNRQGNFCFQLLNSWISDSDFSNPLRLQSIFKIKNTDHVLIDEKKLNYNAQYFICKKINHASFKVKPILLNTKLIKNLYIYQNYLACYIIQNFFISFYSQSWEFLKINNSSFSFYKKIDLKIGFKVQFKVNIFPIFNSINLRKNKNLKQKKLFLFLYKKDQSNLKKLQSFYGWGFFSQKKHFLKDFGCVLTLGSLFPDGICFDHHEIMVDFVHFDKLDFLKNYLKEYSNYNHIYNFKKRFFTSFSNSLKLVLFQKIQKNINQKEYFFKKIFLNQTLPHRNFLNFLIFNVIENYYTSFQKTDLNPPKFLNLFTFHSQSPLLKTQFFKKTESFNNIQIKFRTNFNSSVILMSFFSISKRRKRKFLFKDSVINLSKTYKKSQTFYFRPILLTFSKRFHFGLIKKLNFQIFNKGIKNLNSFRIFSSTLDHFSFKNLIKIKFLFNLKNGEIICKKLKNEKTNSIILTRNNLQILSFTQPLNLLKLQRLTVGNFIRYGDKVEEQTLATESGQIVYLDQQKLILRKAIPFLLTSRILINLYQNQVIERNTRLFKFLYYRIKAGDIIQGIPKIEELFEARTTRGGMPLLANLHIKLQQLFKKFLSKFSVFKATQKSFEIIQQIIVDEIQKIYCSQGVYISDKHLEIVIRQMTSKVRIIEGGRTGLLYGELIEFSWIQLIHQKLANEKIFYEPILLGITKSCLETESFISAASFQETTRILTKSAIQKKVDFVRGLKQNVILGNLVPAGTGYQQPLPITLKRT